MSLIPGLLCLTLRYISNMEYLFIALSYNEVLITLFALLQIGKLIEYYQQLAHRERQERERKKLARRRQCMPLAFSVLCSRRDQSSLSKTFLTQFHDLFQCQTAFSLYFIRACAGTAGTDFRPSLLLYLMLDKYDKYCQIKCCFA